MDTSGEQRVHSLRKSRKKVIGGRRGRPRSRKSGKNNSRSKRERIRIDDEVLNGPT